MQCAITVSSDSQPMDLAAFPDLALVLTAFTTVIASPREDYASRGQTDFASMQLCVPRPQDDCGV